MKGWKTLLWGALMAGVGGVIPYVAGIDWTLYVDPRFAAVVGGVVTIVLRFFTTTAVGKSS